MSGTLILCLLVILVLVWRGGTAERTREANRTRPAADTLGLREAARILGVPEDAEEAAINTAWRERMLRHHPDRSGTDADDSLAVLINEAREVMLARARHNR